MVTLAYVRDKPEWQTTARLSFSEVIAEKHPSFVFLLPGDLVLTIEPGAPRFAGVPEWVLGRLFKVSRWEDYGEGFEYFLDLETVLSDPVSQVRHVVSREELLRVHNWFPAPEWFVKPFPRAVWTWLRENK